MPRQKRIAKGNIVYHVLNRANGRLRIFKTPADFEAFEQILAEGIEQFSMRLCGYCIMGNHWHLVLWPRADGDLSSFMKWITMTHSHRRHGARGTIGIGHQPVGWVVSTHRVRRNTLCYRKTDGSMTHPTVPWPRTGADKPIPLSDGPIVLPKRWQSLADGLDAAGADEIETCIHRGRPFGDAKWTQKTDCKLSLESSLRPTGRPRKEQKE